MASFTPEDMSGKYKLNKQLSTNMEDMMQIQKVGWLVAGIPGTANNRRLDGTSVEEKDPILGLINKRAQSAILGDVSEDHLKDAWKSVKDGWKTIEITTVQEIDGQVRLVLYCVGTNDKGEVVCGRIVYDRVDK
ncbi:hypothetical protein BDZ89DRAFT_1173573 [Hymenopellis radicata]|nr:hypothetical protein BDZ89DRAFT_1173573 [Hymenopellis radicata]